MVEITERCGVLTAAGGAAVHAAEDVGVGVELALLLIGRRL